MRRLPWRVALVAAAGALAAACAPRLPTAEAQGAHPSEQDFAQIERGRYLAVAADCAACHADPGGSGALSGGRPIATPFGTVVAPNITPDRVSGIGGWNDAQFDGAVRLGRAPDGKWLYPAMPFPYYSHMSAGDVAAIHAYLKTLAPVRHAVQADQLPFPFDIRAGMRLWDALYFKPGVYHADPAKSAEWNRGAYLVRGPGHCAACHTPKSHLGGDRAREPLQGYALQGWFAPDIAGGQLLGLGLWSTDDVVAYLRTGHNRFAAASGPMAEEVADSTSRLAPPDLSAIAVYLKNEPDEAAHRGVPFDAREPAMQSGAAIYADMCSACHRDDGKGVPYLFPNLADSSFVASNDPTSLVRVLIHGAQSVATRDEPTGPAMPAFGRQLTDDEIAAVATYVRNSWGHAAPTVSANDVRKVRSERGAG
ncbi:MAG: cytochrome c [Steroidobacteraceae bacterium]